MEQTPITINVSANQIQVDAYLPESGMVITRWSGPSKTSPSYYLECRRNDGKCFKGLLPQDSTTATLYRDSASDTQPAL